jgi:hypothetical protein
VQARSEGCKQARDLDRIKPRAPLKISAPAPHRALNDSAGGNDVGLEILR